MVTRLIKAISPSRSYVAACLRQGFAGYYFRQFTLPEDCSKNLKNNTEDAAWYFLNVLDMTACIDGCFTLEDFRDVKPT